MQKWKFGDSSRLLLGIRCFSIIMIIVFTWMTLYTWKQRPKEQYFTQQVEQNMNTIK